MIVNVLIEIPPPDVPLDYLAGKAVIEAMDVAHRRQPVAVVAGVTMLSMTRRSASGLFPAAHFIFEVSMVPAAEFGLAFGRGGNE